MRILAVQETDWIDRNPILHHRMLEALSTLGHEVRVVDFEILWRQRGWLPLWQRRREIYHVHRFFDDTNVTVIRPAMLRIPGLGRPSWLGANWAELSQQFDSFRPDVVVAYSISNAYLALLLARKYRVPFVYHLLDALHTLVEPPLLRPIARAVEQRVLGSADRIIVVNTHLKSYAVELGADASRLDVIPMGVTVSRDPGVDGETIRAALNLSESDFVLLFVGWLYTFSGLRELVIELGRQKVGLPDVKLLIVGDGDLLPELHRLRAELDLEDCLILTGRRPRQEMAGYIAAADMCLLPAHRNVTMEHIVPAKIIEYMEQGKPVIATRLPGLEAEFGTLPGMHYVDTPGQVLDRVRALLSGSVSARLTAAQLGESCFQFMQRREDWDTVTARFETVLSDAVREATGPALLPES
jgi:glycosyltransferase involved in cell wall biosynthesis